MIVLKINNQVVDLYGDESIQLTASFKDVRNFGSLTADYTNTFKIPATGNNNIILRHYLNPDVVNPVIPLNGRLRASIEIDSIPYKDGTVTIDGGVYKQNKIDSYDVTFYSNEANLRILIGQLKLKDLDWTAYNHTRTADVVRTGLNGSGTLNFGSANDIIYPLIQRRIVASAGHTQWTPTTLAAGSISPFEFFPAIRMRRVFDAVVAYYADQAIPVTVSSNFFSQSKFDNLYMYCPTEIETSDDSPIFDPKGTVMEIDSWSQPNGVGVPSDNYIDIDAALSQPDSNQIRYQITINPVSQVQLFTLHTYYGDEGGNFTEWLSDDYTGNQQFTVQLGATMPSRIKWYVTCATDIDIGSFIVDVESRRNNGGSWASLGTGSSSNLEVRDPSYYFYQRLPHMNVIDWINGLMDLYNMVIIAESYNVFRIEPYDDWIQEGDKRELSKYIDIEDFKVIRPRLPKSVEFKHKDTESIINAKYNDLFGKFYGNTEGYSTGDGDEVKIETPFSNLLWGSSDSSDLQIGSTYNDDFKELNKEIFIFWLGASDTACDIDLQTWSSPITTYKTCGSFYPLETPTDTLNFDFELNPFNLVSETVGLYDQYYSKYFISNINSRNRFFQIKGVFSDPFLIDLKLNDHLHIGDRYYLLNKYVANLTTNEVDLEVTNLHRPIDAIIPPPVDNDPPTVGTLNIVQNPDVTAPTAPTNLVSSNELANSIDISWDHSTDINGIAFYRIYYTDGTPLTKDINGSFNTSTIINLDPLTQYDIYVTAFDPAGNESTQSNTIQPTTTNINPPVITSSNLTIWQVPAMSSGYYREYYITATHSPNLFDEINMPSFMSLNTSTGVISSTLGVVDAGIYDFSVRASNDAGVSWGAFKEIRIVVEVI